MVAIATTTDGSVGFGARLWGALRLRAAAYREIAADTAATRQALRIVIGVALLTALVAALRRAGQPADTALFPRGYGIPDGYMLDLPTGTNPALILAGRLGIGLLFALLSWSASARMLALAARLVLRQRSARAPFLRTVGFAQPFSLVALLPIVGPPAGLVLTAIATVVGVREATGATTGKAFLIWLAAAFLTVAFIALIAAAITVAVIVAIRVGG